MASWERPAVFSWLAALGVEEDEMRRVFNLGVGYRLRRPARTMSSSPCGRWSPRGSRRGWPAVWSSGEGRRTLTLRVGVLISGSGSNLQALIDDPAPDRRRLRGRSTRADAPAVSPRAGSGDGCRALVATDERDERSRLAGAARRRAGGARRLHGDPLARVRRPVQRTDAERASLAAARLPRLERRPGRPGSWCPRDRRDRASRRRRPRECRYRPDRAAGGVARLL